MKKLFMFLTMLLMVVLSASAQTYCYKYAYSVDPDTGAKERPSGEAYRYYTFNGNYCYETDRDGYKKNNIVLQYKGSQNNILVYEDPENLAAIIGWKPTRIHVASDFSRLNYISGIVSAYSKNRIQVWERVESPESQKAPVQLY
jgi:hypothetical protein